MNGVCLSRVDAKLVMVACWLYEERLILEDEYHKVATKSLKQNALAGSTINPTDSKIDPFFNRLLHSAALYPWLCLLVLCLHAMQSMTHLNETAADDAEEGRRNDLCIYILRE